MQNYPPPGQGYPPPGGAYAQPPIPPKKSKTPWIIAGVGCLAIIVIGVILLIGGGLYLGSKVQSTQTKNVPPPTLAAGTKQYVSTRAGLNSELAEHFVDFSFNYPDNWNVVPNQTKNFVKVERSEDGTTLENFAVGWISATGTAFDKQLMPQLAKQLTTQFGQSFADFEKVSEGETKIGPYEAYEVKFTATLKGTQQGDADIYGRVALLPPPSGEKKGVALIMLTTNLAPEIKSVDDVGVKGELPVILDSFRFGAKD